MCWSEWCALRGGLSAVNVLATTFLSGISGSAVADTSAIGSVMIPQMEKTGYPRVFATNVTISASVQALLVPPSHNAVIYSLATGGTISIISLFMAGVTPGLLLGASLIVLCLVLAYRNGHPRGETVPVREAVKIAIEALWGLVTLVIILGGILGGVFTAIEAGAVACLWAFFVTMFIYRDYRWRELPQLIHRTMRTVAMVMTLIAFASSVGYVMALMQVPAKVTALLLTLSSDKNVILLLINVLLLVLGCLLDMAPSILICTPILLPVVVKFGVDPVHFGMIMLLNLGIGLCHPPVGSILFVGCAVGRVTIEQVVREIWPFYAVMFIVLMLVTYIPSISLWLPRTAVIVTPWSPLRLGEFAQFVVNTGNRNCNLGRIVAVYRPHRYVPQRCTSPVGPARRQDDRSPGRPPAGAFLFLPGRARAAGALSTRLSRMTRSNLLCGRSR